MTSCQLPVSDRYRSHSRPSIPIKPVYRCIEVKVHMTLPPKDASAPPSLRDRELFRKVKSVGREDKLTGQQTMTSIIETCKEMQELEWQTLEALYPNITQSRASLDGGTFVLDIPVEFTNATMVYIKTEDKDTVKKQNHAILISHLPPLREELFTSINLLQQDLSGQSIHLQHHNPSALVQLLVDYNAMALTRNYQSSKYECPKCLKRVFGQDCLELSCTHIICRACLLDAWTRSISEGRVDSLYCLHTSCATKSRQALREEVKAILSPEDFDKWEAISLGGVVHCPRAYCKRPVKGEAGSEPGWDSFRTCECGFTFCAACLRSWHGPHTPHAVLYMLQVPNYTPREEFADIGNQIGSVHLWK
ncbi:hypothetical protein BU17DRAFT_70303 [Hysterangium stoloniferum]|nr:hypothetical protein BU17DRAFT_70303 [Hysterangium stoloniferum]